MQRALHATKPRRTQPAPQASGLSEIALRIDAQGGNSVDGSFLEEGEAQTRLAAAGHPDAHGVCGQVFRIVENRNLGWLAKVWIEDSAQVELAEPLDVDHGCSGSITALSSKSFRAISYS
jgi:hypothetical protein